MSDDYHFHSFMWESKLSHLNQNGVIAHYIVRRPTDTVRVYEGRIMYGTYDKCLGCKTLIWSAVARTPLIATC